MTDKPNFDRLDRIERALDRLTERQEALSESLELTHRDVDGLQTAADQLITVTQQDGENIRALARIAEKGMWPS